MAKKAKKSIHGDIVGSLIVDQYEDKSFEISFVNFEVFNPGKLERMFSQVSTIWRQMRAKARFDLVRDADDAKLKQEIVAEQASRAARDHEEISDVR